MRKLITATSVALAAAALATPSGASAQTAAAGPCDPPPAVVACVSQYTLYVCELIFPTCSGMGEATARRAR